MKFALAILPPPTPLEDALAGLDGPAVRFVAADTRAGQQVVRYEIGGSKVDVLNDPAHPAFALVCLEGDDALDVAVALAQVFAFVPAELIAARVRSNTDPVQRLAALVVLAQVTSLGTLPLFVRITAGAVAHALKDTDVSVRQFARAVEDGMPPAVESLEPSKSPSFLVLPVEPLTASLERLPAEFARERTGDGWLVHDRAGRDARARITMNETRQIGAAHFTGSAAAAFAFELLKVLRYLPTELAKEAAAGMKDPAGCVRIHEGLALLDAARHR